MICFFTPKRFAYLCSVFVFLLMNNSLSFAHGVDENTKAFLVQSTGVEFASFVYIGAKHMITGYDHLLFLVGVIFFLYRLKDVLLYVSLFTLGHSLTLLFGVLNNIQINPYLIDAIIGFSILYKGFDNLGGFERLLNCRPNPKWAVLIFGLFHGFGLATKIQDFNLEQQSLLINLLAFNLGVEIGQFIALILVILLINYWRQYRSFTRFSTAANTLLMSGGIMLIGYQITGYLINTNFNSGLL